MPQTLDSLLTKVVEPLAKELEAFLRTNRETQLINFVPNLAWSASCIKIQNENLWTNIDRLVLKISGRFNLNQLASLLPVYHEFQDPKHKTVIDALETRFQALAPLEKEKLRDYQVCEDIISKRR